jgi:hypothetical protein
MAEHVVKIGFDNSEQILVECSCHWSKVVGSALEPPTVEAAWQAEQSHLSEPAQATTLGVMTTAPTEITKP